MKNNIKKIGVLATGCFLFWLLGLSKSKNEPAPINKTMEVTSKIVEVATGAKIYQPAPRASAIVPIALKVTGTCVLAVAIAAAIDYYMLATERAAHTKQIFEPKGDLSEPIEKFANLSQSRRALNLRSSDPAARQDFGRDYEDFEDSKIKTFLV